jgi:hypothetical protein
MKKTALFGIELPPKARAAFDHANAVLPARFANKQLKSKVVASAVVSSASAAPVQPVVEQHNAEPTPEAAPFARLSLSEQKRELRRLIGRRRLGLDDDRVAEIMKEARAPYVR